MGLRKAPRKNEVEEHWSWSEIKRFFIWKKTGLVSLKKRRSRQSMTVDNFQFPIAGFLFMILDISTPLGTLSTVLHFYLFQVS